MSSFLAFLKKLLFACVGTVINLIMQWSSSRLLAPASTPAMLHHRAY